MNKIKKKKKYLKGFSYSRFFYIFRGIRARCNNPNRPCYPRYGGIGIRCEWVSFSEFHNDMYHSYLRHVKKYGEKNTTIDRIDPFGNYSKKNCKWSTWKEQDRNKRNTIYLTFQGKTYSLSEWADKTGIKRQEIWRRIFDRNWSIERALTHKPRKAPSPSRPRSDG